MDRFDFIKSVLPENWIVVDGWIGRQQSTGRNNRSTHYEFTVFIDMELTLKNTEKIIEIENKLKELIGDKYLDIEFSDGYNMFSFVSKKSIVDNKIKMINRNKIINKILNDIQ